MNITQLRTLTNTKASAIGSGIAEAARFKEIGELTGNIIASVKAVSFPGKEALLDNLGKMQISLIAVKEK